MNKLILALLLLFSFSSYSQKESLKEFLEAYTTLEFEESKKKIENLSFGLTNTYTMSEYGNIKGILTDTGINNIKGYKAIINCKLQTKAKTFIEKRIIVIMYVDKTDGKWKVFELRDAVDPKYEFNSLLKSVSKGKFYTKKEYVYRSMSYWALMSSYLLECKKYIDLAEDEAKKSNNVEYKNRMKGILNKII